MSDFSSKWISEKQIEIFSKAKGMLLSELKTNYPSLRVTQDNATPTNTQLPTIYVDFVAAPERGQTLDGTTVNAVSMTIDVHVKTSNDQGAVANNDIAWAVVDVFKTFGFTSTMPNMATSDYNGVYESVSRFSRVIGQGDKI